MLFVTTSWVQTERTGSPGASDGLAASLYDCVADGKSVKDAVYAWYRQDRLNPWPWPIQVATQEAIEAGYLASQQQHLGGKIGSIFTGAVPTSVVPGKEAEVRAIGDEAANKWSGYGAKDTALLDLLVKQCSGAISARAQQTGPDA
ncbi:MAG TPA: hypothetical protein VJP85_10995 [Candidatus Baltobacteraceae bacterium]|nr:hypothetical protein [Candidatus Baltobacteraceae bacterium]